MDLYIIWWHKEEDWDTWHPEIHAIFTSKEKAEKYMIDKELAELNKWGRAISEGYQLEETTTDD